MSEENVEVVRGLHAPYEGKNLVPFIRESVEQLGPDPQPEAVLAWWADDPGWQHVHPDVEWDSSGSGAMGRIARGPQEVAAWWVEWVEAWDSYVFRPTEYRDLGDWVLVRVVASGRGREGISVEMATFEIYRVRDGKIAAYRSFRSEREALEAAGLSE